MDCMCTYIHIYYVHSTFRGRRVTMAALKTAMTFIAVLLAMEATITLSDGTPTFIQYPASPVPGAQGSNISLTCVAVGTGEQDTVIVQGPNPLTGSKLSIIYELAKEADPYEPYKGNYSVTHTWSNGTTVVAMTILDFQPGDVGTYKLSVGFLIGSGVNVTELVVPDATAKTTVTSQTTKGGLVNTTAVDPTGSTSGGGLPGWATAIIVVASLILASACIYLIYRWRNSRTPAQDPPVRYDPVKNGDADPNVQVLNGVGKQGGQVGAEELNGARVAVGV
ncbi:uncharacterized protein LOC144920691 isoform X2 [Branchiostoma floridae x Branchiostoma belcheri]